MPHTVLGSEDTAMNKTDKNLALRKLTFYLNNSYVREANEMHEIRRKNYRASLVAQWLRICLLMQETRVRALVWEDPTCHGAAGPVSHSC